MLHLSLDATDVAHCYTHGRTILSLYRFVGHMENAVQDSQRLLEQLGVWEEYGATGWGEQGDKAIFDMRTCNQWHRLPRS